jgi:uncharacterized protein DUF6551
VTAAPDPGPRPELAWLPVERLVIDPRYQREIDSRRSRAHIAKIAANFRWARFGAILVTPRGAAEAGGGRGWTVIDGQHRIAAARECGFDLVPAVVIGSAGLAEQASAFVWANRTRVPMSAQALHRANLVAGDVEAVTLDRLCRAAGVEILHYPMASAKLPPGKLVCVPALLKLLRRKGEAITGQAVALVAEAWREQPGALRSPLFAAAAEYLSEGGEATALRQRLKRLDFRRVEQMTGNLGGDAPSQAILAALKRINVAIGAAAPSPPAEAPEHGKGQPRFDDDPRAVRDRGSPRTLFGGVS